MDRCTAGNAHACLREYRWFGVSRLCHNISLEGDEPYIVPGTNDAIPENSAILMTCDLAVPDLYSSGSIYSARGYADGDVKLSEALKTCLDEKGTAYIRIEDPDQLTQFCAVTVNTEEVYEGTPDLELITAVNTDSRLVVMTAPDKS